MEEGDLNILLFNYWKYLVLGAGEIYFLEVSPLVPLKRATAGFWEGRFCRFFTKISQIFKYNNGVVGPKAFYVCLITEKILP